MKNNQEKSILLKELEENEECKIEYKKGKLFLNNKDITNNRNELFKILKQSILSLQKSVEQLEKKLKRLFGKEMLTSNIVKSTKYFNTQTHFKTKGLWNNEDNNEKKKKKNQKKAATPQEREQEQPQNNIIDKLQENILIQQYYSIISMESFLNENKITSQKKQNRKQEEEDEFLNNQGLNLNQMIQQFTEDEPEKIQFISPLNKTKNNTQIFDLEYYKEIEIQQSGNDCKLCNEKNNKMKKMNNMLKSIEKVFIFELLFISIAVDQKCHHTYKQKNLNDEDDGDDDDDDDYDSDGEDGEYFHPNINQEFGNLSNLKYRKLQLETGCFLQNMRLYNNPNHKVIIIQDEYLKKLDLDSLFLPSIVVKQKQNQYLSCLTISSTTSDDFDCSEMQQYLKNIRFSELQILYQMYLKNYELRDEESLDHIPLMQILIEEDNSVEDEDKEKVEIINERYTHALCFFTFHKLFNDDFSIFRLAYDLYDQL